MAASSFAKRQKAAQSLGYTGYAQQRKARATGIGLQGSDRPRGAPGGAAPAATGTTFARRQAKARELGYTGYAQRRKAFQTGEGLKGTDIADAPKIAARRRIFSVGERTLIRLTKGNAGEAEVRGRATGPDQAITVTWEARRKSGDSIRFTRETSWAELDTYDSFEAFAEADTATEYTGGSWAGAIHDIQVTLGK